MTKCNHEIIVSILKSVYYDIHNGTVSNTYHEVSAFCSICLEYLDIDNETINNIISIDKGKQNG